MDGYTDNDLADSDAPHWTVAAQAAKDAKRKRQKLEQLLLEKHRRQGVSTYLIGRAFDKQQAFITDPKRFKTLLGARRSGKSFALALYLFHEAFKKSRTEVIFVSLARDSSRRNFFEKILKRLGQDIQEELGIACKFNHNTMTVTLPNGSHIYVVSSDASESEKHKLRGLAFSLVVIDEAQDFRTDLKQTVEDVLGPGMVDDAGTICLSGTPNNNIRSFFHEVTNTDKHPEFSKHGWKGEENPHVADNFKADKAAKIAANPLIVNDPAFRQEWEGEWVISPDALVYHYSTELNHTDLLPFKDEEKKIRWTPDAFTCVMGLDTGWTDASSIVIAGYHPGSPILYVLEVWKESGVDYITVGEMVRHFQARYNLVRIVVDNSARQGMETLRRRMQLPLYAAQKGNSKTLKSDYIAMFNSDLIGGRIMTVGAPCQPLVEEWQTLIWDERSAKMLEKAGMANHAADACLYAWLASRNYLERPKAPKPVDGSPEWIKARVDEIERTVNANRNKPFWDRDK